MKYFRLKLYIFTTLLLIFATQLSALTFPHTDTFSGDSADGWSRDDGDSNELQINQDRETHKTFDFTNTYANASVTVTFVLRTDDDWENSGSAQDYFYVQFNNGTQIIESYTDGTRTRTYSTNLDANGQLLVSLATNTTASGEIAYIDNFTITLDVPVTPTITAENFSIYNQAPDGTIVGTITSTNNPTTFTINSGNVDNIFAVSNSGEITIASNVNLESNTTNTYSLSITGSNAAGSDTENFIITLVDDIALSTADVNTRAFTNVPINGKNSVTINGSILQIGNQLLCKNTSDGATCENPTAGTPNNSFTQHKAKIDTSAGAPASNTMAKLVFQPGDEVVMARLYWSARVENITSTQKTDAKTLQLKGPNAGSYTSFTSPNSKYNWHQSGTTFDYVASQDVTEYVKAQGEGEYYAGGIVATNGTNMYASWQLIVVVENTARSMKNIAIYDGFYSVHNSGDYPSNATADATGFITPTGTSPFDANLFIYMGESDSSYGDSVELLNKDGDPTVAGDWTKLIDGAGTNTDVVNASVYSLDYTNGYRSNDAGMANPNYRNVLGVDIDKLPINIKTDVNKQVLSNSQTQTKIRISSTGDRFSLNMFAFETEVFVPEFCYDYAYYQDGQPFTEDNDGTKFPKLTGNVGVNSPIEMKLFIKSYVDSSITITNMLLDVDDINTSQATHISGSTELIRSGELTPTTVAVTEGTSNGFDFIHNVPIGTLLENEYFYLYYDLDPQQNTMDMPINITATYDLTLDSTPVEYSLKLSNEIPLCPSSNFNYTPAKGAFNVVHNNNYTNTNPDTTSLTSGIFYNLPTQVVKREGNFKVLIMDETNDYNNLSNNHPAIPVAVELIDAGAFHYADASCTEFASSISERVWVVIDQNAVSEPFTKAAIEEAITNGRTKLTNSADFYKVARENAAFRLTWNSVDDNGSIVQLEAITSGSETRYNVTNFPSLSGSCVQDIDGNPNSNDLISQFCSNAGSPFASAMDESALTTCMECVYGSNTRFSCSRDNFSIRPEAFMVKIDDQNQTNPTQQARLADTVSGVTTTPTTIQLQLAAGYDYSLEVNATNYLSNDSAFGYTKSFTENLPDLIKYAWNPSGTSSGCNTITDKNTTGYIYNGAGEFNTSVNEVGEYELSILDTTWTAVDSTAANMQHHTGKYFASGTDCIVNNSDTQLVNSATYNGCNISSNHDAVASALKYRNYNVRFHPYKFSIEPLVPEIGPILPETLNGNFPSIGLNHQAIGNDAYVYMADMSKLSSGIAIDDNMSVHFNTKVSALGYNDTPLSNFVNNCYAQQLDLNISKSDTDHSSSTNSPLTFQYRLHNLDRNDNYVNSTSYNEIFNLGHVPAQVLAPQNYFTKDLNGSLRTLINLNYNREANSSANPIRIQFHDYNVSCNSGADCSMNADLAIHNPEGNFTFIDDVNVTYFYGRTNAPRTRFTTNANQAVQIYYEIYCNGTGCDRNLLPTGNDSNYTDDSRWMVNTMHTADFGDANTTTQKGANINIAVNVEATGNHQDSVTISYDGQRGYPYKATMQNAAKNWLLYNRYDRDITRNEFEVEFDTTNSNWAGQDSANSATDVNGSARTNRRSMW